MLAGECVGGRVYECIRIYLNHMSGIIVDRSLKWRSIFKGTSDNDDDDDHNNNGNYLCVY